MSIAERAQLIRSLAALLVRMAERVARLSLDVLVANEGTVFLFNPITSRAKQRIKERVQPDAQWFGTTLVVEQRYAWRLAVGMLDAGLALR